jgi:hypothetical protein
MAMRWKPALNAFAITFSGRISPTGNESAPGSDLPFIGRSLRCRWDIVVARITTCLGPCNSAGAPSRAAPRSRLLPLARDESAEGPTVIVDPPADAVGRFVR